MEVAGLVIGIVPLAVEVFKAWKLVHEKAVQFVKATMIVDSLYCRVNTQGLLFRREFSGLLHAIGIDAKVAEAMLADNKHSRWEGASVDVARYLGTDCEKDYVRLAEQIVLQLQELRRKLEALGDVYALRRRVRSSSSPDDREKVLNLTRMIAGPIHV